MPRGDKTGPQGLGPMTGRAAGNCAGYDVPGYMDPIAGRGRGRNGGRGRRNRRTATGMPGWARAGAPSAQPAAAPEQELFALRAQAERLEGALKNIKKRIDETEAQTATDEAR